MDKFRKNAHVLHADVTKRRLVAKLTKKESELQIFNSTFTRNMMKAESEECGIELWGRNKQSHRSRIEARIEAKMTANSMLAVNDSLSVVAPTSGTQSDSVLTAQDNRGLFDYLSPIDSSEDDCDEHKGFLRQSISLTIVESEIKDIPPWIEALPLPPIEDRALTHDFMTQTNFPARTVADVDLETEGVDFKNAETQFMIPDNKSVANLSAVNTMYYELTKLIYLDDLLTWYSTDPVTQTRKIKVVPLTTPTAEIVSFHNFAHLQSKFVLVVKDNTNIAIEIWSLSNLINPKIIQIPLPIITSKILCSTSLTCLFISNRYKISVIDFSNLASLNVVNLEDYNVSFITAMSTNETNLLLSNHNTFFYFSTFPNVRLLKKFPKKQTIPSEIQKTLLLTNKAAFAICSDVNTFILCAYNPETGLHLNTTNNLQFEVSGLKLFPILPDSMDHQINVISTHCPENNLVTAFDCRLQVAVIIDVERFIKFGEIEYRFDFTHPEIPVYFAVATKLNKTMALFSIDNVGRISQWTLLPKNRKMRSNLMSSNVENSFVAFSLRGNRFMMASTNEVTVLCLIEK